MTKHADCFYTNEIANTIIDNKSFIGIDSKVYGANSLYRTTGVIEELCKIAHEKGGEDKRNILEYAGKMILSRMNSSELLTCAFDNVMLMSHFANVAPHVDDKLRSARIAIAEHVYNRGMPKFKEPKPKL